MARCLEELGLSDADALGLLTETTAQYAETLGVAADNLGDFMAGIEAQIADLAPDPDVAERIAAVQAETEALVARAVELGAGEEQIARVRELGQLRLNGLLEEQATLLEEQAALIASQEAAAGDLREFLANISAEAAGGITPLTSELQRLRGEGLNLIGPLPADTLFTPKHLDHCDAVLAMYHDQGLPVLKYKGFGAAVNVTLGLPIIRTSVDHGTALDLAGTGQIDCGSLQVALQTAYKMAASQLKSR